MELNTFLESCYLNWDVPNVHNAACYSKQHCCFPLISEKPLRLKRRHSWKKDGVRYSKTKSSHLLSICRCSDDVYSTTKTCKWYIWHCISSVIVQDILLYSSCTARNTEYLPTFDHAFENYLGLHDSSIWEQLIHKHLQKQHRCSTMRQITEWYTSYT